MFAVVAAMAGGSSGHLRSRTSPVMSPAQSGTLPVQATGLGQQGGYDSMSQGLLLQQAAMALHMAQLGQQGLALGSGQEPDQAMALHAGLRNQHQGTLLACSVILTSHI